jgi:hypothetical protein
MKEMLRCNLNASTVSSVLCLLSTCDATIGGVPAERASLHLLCKPPTASPLPSPFHVVRIRPVSATRVPFTAHLDNPLGILDDPCLLPMAHERYTLILIGLASGPGKEAAGFQMSP